MIHRNLVVRRWGTPQRTVGSVNEPREWSEQGHLVNEKWIYLAPRGEPDAPRERIIYWLRYDFVASFVVDAQGELRREDPTALFADADIIFWWMGSVDRIGGQIGAATLSAMPGQGALGTPYHHRESAVRAQHVERLHGSFPPDSQTISRAGFLPVLWCPVVIPTQVGRVGSSCAAQRSLRYTCQEEVNGRAGLRRSRRTDGVFL